MKYTATHRIPYAEPSDFVDDFPANVSQPSAERIDDALSTIGTSDWYANELVRRNDNGSAEFGWVDLVQPPQLDHHATHKGYVDGKVAAVADDVSGLDGRLTSAESTVSGLAGDVSAAADTLADATSAPTPGTLAKRDPISGSLDVGPPANGDSAVNRDYVDSAIDGIDALTTATHTAEPDTLVKRDAAGDAIFQRAYLEVSEPYTDDGVTSKRWVDQQISNAVVEANAYTDAALQAGGQWQAATLVSDPDLLPDWATQSIRAKDNGDGTASVHINLWLQVLEPYELMETIYIGDLPSSITLSAGMSGFTVSSKGADAAGNPTIRELLFEFSDYDNSISVYVPADYANFQLNQYVGTLPTA